MRVNMYDPFANFDRLANVLFRSLQAPNGAPDYDVVRTGENSFALALAVPGYAQDELSLSVHEGVLTVAGQAKVPGQSGVTWLYRGIPRGGFERRFALADHVEVRDAQLKDGVLTIQLAREVPEALKPRTITIGGGEAQALPKAA